MSDRAVGMTDASRYPAEVFWSPEDECFIAVARDLPGCSAAGETRDAALQELLPAIEAWREAAAKAGNPIPEPTLPPELSDYSGRFVLRLPRSLHAQLARRAKSEGVSLNALIVTLLASQSAASGPIDVAHAVATQIAEQIKLMASGLTLCVEPPNVYSRVPVGSGFRSVPWPHSYVADNLRVVVKEEDISSSPAGVPPLLSARNG
jgi:predicted RNase H-like HicB family nuclease